MCTVTVSFTVLVWLRHSTISLAVQNVIKAKSIYGLPPYFCFNFMKMLDCQEIELSPRIFIKPDFLIDVLFM